MYLGGVKEEIRREGERSVNRPSSVRSYLDDNGKQVVHTNKSAALLSPARNAWKCKRESSHAECFCCTCSAVIS